jgi:alpha-tubulin suppressor-like RCC1 family protein
MRSRYASWFGLFAVASLIVVAAGCAPTPPPPLPDPIITCATLGGDITYSPPASTAGVDITINAQPGTGLSGCSDHTGSGITAGTFQSTSFLLPAYACSSGPAGTEWGSGTGEIRWSNASTSAFTARLISGSPYASTIEFTFTGGMWAGARASLPFTVTSSSGDCVTVPVTTASVSSTAPFVLRPPLPPPLSGATQIAAGTSHTCALTSAGTVKCWGSNEYGQLGNGAVPSPGAASDLPVDVVGISGAVQVTAGDFHSCALIQDGTVRCWGYGGRGELGDGTATSHSSPVTVSGIDDATSIAQGLAHTCALLPGGTVKCWGYNFWGSLGDGTNTNSDVPVDVIGLTGVASIATGGDETCSLDASHHARCWGPNGSGQLGDGTTTNRNTPADVVGLAPATELAIGRNHACARLTDGSVDCWGQNNSGQLGDGTNLSRTAPAAVVGISDATGAGAGWSHSCALRSGGSISCWGENLQGQLGDGTTANHNTPVDVTTISHAVQVSGGHHTCALLVGGGVDCWGLNSSGQLGDGTRTTRTLPVPVRAGP